MDFKNIFNKVRGKRSATAIMLRPGETEEQLKQRAMIRAIEILEELKPDKSYEDRQWALKVHKLYVKVVAELSDGKAPYEFAQQAQEALKAAGLLTNSMRTQFIYSYVKEIAQEAVLKHQANSKKESADS